MCCYHITIISDIRHLYGMKIILYLCQSQRCGVNNHDDDENIEPAKIPNGEGVNDDDIDARGGAFELEFGFALDNLSHPVRAEKRDF